MNLKAHLTAAEMGWQEPHRVHEREMPSPDPWKSPQHWYRLGTNCLKSVFAEERPGVVAMKPTMSKQYSPVEIPAALGEVLLGGQST